MFVLQTHHPHQQGDQPKVNGNTNVTNDRFNTEISKPIPKDDSNKPKSKQQIKQNSEKEQKGHSATRCPVLDESFPFMLPGWRAQKTPGGYIMISPRVAADRRRSENGD